MTDAVHLACRALVGLVPDRGTLVSFFLCARARSKKPEGRMSSEPSVNQANPSSHVG